MAAIHFFTTELDLNNRQRSLCAVYGAHARQLFDWAVENIRVTAPLGTSLPNGTDPVAALDAKWPHAMNRPGRNIGRQSFGRSSRA
ncbi:MAG: hypothetical protein WKF37_17750 [Bryobacteraceae bacterium]